MAHFKGILLDTGARLLTESLLQGNTCYPDHIQTGSGIFPADFDDERAVITELVEPLNLESVIKESLFIDVESNTRGVLRIETEVNNRNITEVAAIRELILYANSTWDTDENGNIIVNKNGMAFPTKPGTPFAYAWLVGEDVDNVLPVPGIAGGGGQVITYHYHTIELYVLNQFIDIIEVIVNPGAGVSREYLNARLRQLIELSPQQTPANGTRLHKQIIADEPNFNFAILGGVT